MKQTLIALVLGLFVMNGYAGTQDKLIDPYEESIGMLPDVTVTKPKVKKALIAAAYKLGWTVEEQKDDLLQATLLVRSHRLVINIQYDTTKLIAKYKESDNLNYEIDKDGAKIHPSYHRWVKNLFKETRGLLVMYQ
jgi:hypothetical protein